MKKTTTIIILSLITKLGFTQGAAENELKNFRFGLKVAPSLNWYKPDDKKKFESSGVRAKFSWGFAAEIRLNKISSIATGIQIDYDGGGLKINDKESIHYYYGNDEILTQEEAKTKNIFTQNRLLERKYNTNYVTIPFGLKMKTNEIGYLTYYGQFGLNTSIKLKSRVDDGIREYGNPFSSNSSVSDVDVTDDAAFFKLALNVGIGAEYNLTGSASIVFGIYYTNGFTNVLKSESKYLLRDNNGTLEALKQKATANNIALQVGVLF